MNKDTRPRLAHRTGLGCSEGVSVVFDTAEGKLIFEAEREKYIEEIMVADIQNIYFLKISQIMTKLLHISDKSVTIDIY